MVSIAFRLLKRLVVEFACKENEKKLAGLNCLSAVEAIGSPLERGGHPEVGVRVSIAFRLLKRLVDGRIVGRPRIRRSPGLNCLSAVEAIGSSA